MKLDEQFWGKGIVALLVPRRRAPVSTFDPVQLETQYSVIHAPGRGEPRQIECWSCRGLLLPIDLDVSRSRKADPFPSLSWPELHPDAEELMRFVCVTCGIGVLVTW